MCSVYEFNIPMRIHVRLKERDRKIIIIIPIKDERVYYIIYIYHAHGALYKIYTVV